MNFSIESWIAIMGISLSSILAISGLFLNYLESRKNNRILISTKLAEAFKEHSDEYISLSRTIHEFENELESTDMRADVAAEHIQKKLAIIRDKLSRMRERLGVVEENSKSIIAMLEAPGSVDPTVVDLMIATSYRNKSVATDELDLAHKLIERNLTIQSSRTASPPAA